MHLTPPAHKGEEQKQHVVKTLPCTPMLCTLPGARLLKACTAVVRFLIVARAQILQCHCWWHTQLCFWGTHIIVSPCTHQQHSGDSHGTATAVGGRSHTGAAKGADNANLARVVVMVQTWQRSAAQCILHVSFSAFTESSEMLAEKPVQAQIPCRQHFSQQFFMLWNLQYSLLIPGTHLLPGPAVHSPIG